MAIVRLEAEVGSFSIQLLLESEHMLRLVSHRHLGTSHGWIDVPHGAATLLHVEHVFHLFYVFLLLHLSSEVVRALIGNLLVRTWTGVEPLLLLKDHIVGSREHMHLVRC